MTSFVTKDIPSDTLQKSGGLSHIIESYLNKYFDTLGDTDPLPGLYEIIIKEVEKPLLIKILQKTNGNQKKAAMILGINRNTLHRKLIEYQIDVAQL